MVVWIIEDQDLNPNLLTALHDEGQYMEILKAQFYNNAVKSEML